MQNNKKYTGAVFFDIDGTLLDERSGIDTPTDVTKAAIAALKAKGYLTVIATGRAKCYVPDMGIDFDGYITCNGAVVEVDNEIIVSKYIEPETLKRLVDYMEEHGLGYNIETRDICYYGKKCEADLFRMMEEFNITCNCFHPLKSLDGIMSSKALVTFDTAEQYENLIREFSGEFMITRHHDYNSGDISIYGTTKATGIQAMIAKLGIDISDTYAFGDDGNDVDMLRTVGCGIAMTPHSPLLDGVAKKFTCGVREDGIAKALQDLGLI